MPLEEITAEHLDDFLHENVRASLLLVKEFAAQRGLCTDDARWITGQVIDSEGGFRLWAG